MYLVRARARDPFAPGRRLHLTCSPPRDNPDWCIGRVPERCVLLREQSAYKAWLCIVAGRAKRARAWLSTCRLIFLDRPSFDVADHITQIAPSATTAKNGPAAFRPALERRKLCRQTVMARSLANAQSCRVQQAGYIGRQKVCEAQLMTERHGSFRRGLQKRRRLVPVIRLPTVFSVAAQRSCATRSPPGALKIIRVTQAQRPWVTTKSGLETRMARECNAMRVMDLCSNLRLIV